MKKVNLVVLLFMSLFIISACSSSVSNEEIYEAGTSVLIRDLSEDLSENFFTQGEYFDIVVSDQNMVEFTDLGDDLYQLKGMFMIESDYPKESGQFEIKVKFIDGEPANYEWSIEFDD